MSRALLLWVVVGAIAGAFAAVAPGTAYLLLLLGVGTALFVLKCPPQDRPFCLMLFAWGVGVRVALALLIGLGGFWQGKSAWLFGDSLGVHNFAWLLAQHLHGSIPLIHEYPPGHLGTVSAFVPLGHPYGYHGMTYVVSGLYYWFGPMPFSARLLNMWFGVAAGLVIFLLARRFFDRRTARVVAVVSVFWPSLMVWSITLLKDALYLLVSAGMLWAFVTWQRTRAPRYLLWIAATVGLQQSLRAAIPHAAIAGVLALIVLVSWVAVRPDRRRWLRLLAVASLTGLILGRAPLAQVAHRVMARAVEYSWGIHATQVLQARKGSVGPGYQIFDVRYYGLGDTGEVRSGNQVTTWDFLNGLVRGLGHLLLVPFPSHMTTWARLAPYPQMVVWYLVLLCVPLGLWRAWRSDPPATAIMIGYLALATSAIALTSGNVGTVFRHRDSLTPFYCLFGFGGLMAFGWPRPSASRRTLSAS